MFLFSGNCFSFCFCFSFFLSFPHSIFSKHAMSIVFVYGLCDLLCWNLSETLLSLSLSLSLFLVCLFSLVFGFSCLFDGTHSESRHFNRCWFVENSSVSLSWKDKSRNHYETEFQRTGTKLERCPPTADESVTVFPGFPQQGVGQRRSGGAGNGKAHTGDTHAWVTTTEEEEEERREILSWRKWTRSHGLLSRFWNISLYQRSTLSMSLRG